LVEVTVRGAGPGPEMTIDSVLDAETWRASTTVKVKEYDPPVLGVPEIVPTEFTVKPGGIWPVADHA
jgi:hypothetical protein